MNTIFTSSKLYQGCVKPHINVLPPQMHGGVSRVSSFSARPTNLMEHNNGSKRSLVVNSGSSIRPEGPKRRRSESIGVLKQPIPFKKASWWSANPLVGQQQQTQNPKDDTSIPTTPRFPARNQAVLQIFDIPASNRINSLHESIMHPPATIHVPSQPSTLSALQHPDEAQRESGGNLPSPKGHSSDDDCSATSSSNDNALNFRAYQAENWTEKFEELLRFRSEHGHCLVPNSFDEKPFLAQWVKRQRYQYKLKLENKRSTMSEERIKALEQIGFIWDSHAAIWDERVYELLDYKRMYGHCNVPSRYAPNRQLAVWVKRQRRQYKFYQDDKPSSMTPQRIARLEAIGFEWDLRIQLGKVETAYSREKWIVETIRDTIKYT